MKKCGYRSGLVRALLNDPQGVVRAELAGCRGPGGELGVEKSAAHLV